VPWGNYRARKKKKEQPERGPIQTIHLDVRVWVKVRSLVRGADRNDLEKNSFGPWGEDEGKRNRGKKLCSGLETVKPRLRNLRGGGRSQRAEKGHSKAQWAGLENTPSATHWSESD